MNPQNKELPVILKWQDFLTWLFPATAKFPKRVRMSFSQRIEELALDVLDQLVQARYAKNKKPYLHQANLCLERLRILLRLAQKLHYMAYSAYEYALRSINEAGKMLGGWMKMA